MSVRRLTNVDLTVFSMFGMYVLQIIGLGYGVGGVNARLGE
jgi:hypothetical protein